jgi:rhodanese-related sulfurtransferase
VSEVPRISVEELKERLDNGEAIVVGDTRPAAVYDVKHIAGAISMPASEIYNESPMDELPLDQEIVLYCT